MAAKTDYGIHLTRYPSSRQQILWLNTSVFLLENLHCVGMYTNFDMRKVS
jgi:hypothetical protein